jgi:hypothetical protein
MKKINKQKKKKVKVMPPFPPVLPSYDLHWSTILRFEATADQNGTLINQSMVLNTVLISYSPIAGAVLFDYVKIRKVRMWTPTGNSNNLTSQGSMRFVGLIGSAGQGTSDETLHSCSSMGFNRPGFLQARPKPNSNAGMFFSVGTGNVMQFYCPTGTIIDLHVTFKNVGGQAQSALNALVGANTGAVYFRGLDGLASATSTFFPPNGAAVI